MAFFERDVAAPVGDLDIALEELAVREGLRELIAYADFLQRSGFYLAVWAVGEACALLLWVFFAFCV